MRPVRPATASSDVRWRDLALLAGFFALSWVAVGANRDAPWIDDWVYAWSVEHLIATGELAVLPFSAVYPIGQVLWAAPFAWMSGFSFVALRASTVVLAVLGCWALHGTLTELGYGRRSCRLGAFALAVHPVFFAMSFSFMTEVPFVALSTLGLFFHVRAAVRNDVRARWIGSAVALGAFLVRPIGVVLPIAAALALGRPARGGRWREHITPLVLSVLTMVALQLLLPRWLGPLDWADIRLEYLDWWSSVPFTRYVAWTAEVLVQSAFPLAPVVVTAMLAQRRGPTAIVAAAVLTLGAWRWGGEIPSPMPHGQMWSLEEISSRAMLPGGVPAHPWALSAQPWLMGAGALVAGALVALAVRSPRRSRPEASRHLRVVWIYGLLQLVSIHALWFYNDRYYLVLAPVIALAAARALDDAPRAQAVAFAGLAVVAVISITGTRDMLAVNHAAAEAVRALEASGVPPSAIDAGYTLNGWRLYAHPEQLAPGADRRTDVPRVTAASSAGVTAIVATRPEVGRQLLRTVPLPAATWQSSRELYVVRP